MTKLFTQQTLRYNPAFLSLNLSPPPNEARKKELNEIVKSLELELENQKIDMTRYTQYKVFEAFKSYATGLLNEKLSLRKSLMNAFKELGEYHYAAHEMLRAQRECREYNRDGYMVETSIYNIANMFLLAGNFERAIIAANYQINLGPTIKGPGETDYYCDTTHIAYAYKTRGLAKALKGELDGGISDLETALTYCGGIGGPFAECLISNDLGELLALKGDLLKAKRMFERSLELAPRKNGQTKNPIDAPRGYDFKIFSKKDLAQSVGNLLSVLELLGEPIEPKLARLGNFLGINIE